MAGYGVINKSKLRADITRNDIVYSWGEETKTPVSIGSGVRIVKVKSIRDTDTTESLAEITKNDGMVVKISKTQDIRIGDVLDITHLGYGSLWSYEVQTIDPQTSRGRTIGIYLKIRRTNES